MKLNRIKEVLEDKGISQTWLAKKLDKSFNTVNSYVCNRSQPNLESLLEISKILSVDLKDLIVDGLSTSKVSLTVRYKFTTARSKYKGTGAGESQKNRM